MQSFDSLSDEERVMMFAIFVAAAVFMGGCETGRVANDGGTAYPDMTPADPTTDDMAHPPDQPRFLLDMAIAPGPYCTGSADLGGLFPLGCGQAGGACCEGFQGEPLQCAPRLVCAQIGSRHVCADPGFTCNEPR